MRIVYHQAHIVFLAQFYHSWQRGDVTFHAEETIDHEEFTFFFWQALEHTLQMVHVVVTEALNLATAEESAINNAGMVFLIHDDNVIFAYQRADGTQIRLHACGED